MPKGRPGLMVDIGTALHVLLVLTLGCVFGGVWLKTGISCIPLGEVSTLIWVLFCAHVIVGGWMLLTWELSLRHEGRLREAAKWAWGLGLALIPFVGVAYHFLYYRTGARA